MYLYSIHDAIHQVSDFELVLENASAVNFSSNYYSFYCHKIFYPLLLHAFQATTQNKIFVFQAIIVSFIPVFMYLLGVLISNWRLGIFASILYIITPSQLVYSAITTEEHLAALVVLLFIVLLLLSVKEYRLSIFIACSIFAGILATLSHFTKDWCIIAEITIILILLMNLIRCLYIRKKPRRITKKLFVFLVIMFSTRFLCNKFIMHKFQEITFNKIQPSVAMSVWLYGSFSPYSNGAYDESRIYKYFEILNEYEGDVEAANKYVYSLLGREILEGIKLMPAFLLHKGQAAYSNSQELFGWVALGFNDKFKNSIKKIWKLAMRFDRIIYVYMVLLFVCGIILNFFNVILRRKIFRIDMVYIGMSLFCIGTIFVSLLVQSQSRYKYSIYWLWCFMAAFGVCRLIRFVEKRFLLKRKEKLI